MTSRRSVISLAAPIPAERSDDIDAAMDAGAPSSLGFSIDTVHTDPKNAVLHVYFPDDPARQSGEAALADIFARLALPFAPVCETLDEDHYLNAYREFLTPQKIDRTLWVVPYSRDRFTPDKLPAVYIDHQYAFGTGTHATTKLALSLLIRAAKKSAKTSLADVGMGSGILSIAAAKLGYREISAVDIEEAAVSCTIANAKDNGVTLSLVAVGSTDTLSGKTFDTVVMNIETEVILSLIESAVPLVRTGGELILSGILASRKREVEARIRTLPLKPLRRKTMGDWHAMLLRRTA